MATQLDLLHQIAENTANSSPLLIAFVAGGSAVAGALLTGLLSYFGIKFTIRSQYAIERQKLQANIVSAERLRWLQDIRSRLANVYAKMDMQVSVLLLPAAPGRIALKQSELDDLANAIMVQVNIIHLMLNPQKPTQAKLRDSLQECLQFLAVHCANPEMAKTESSKSLYKTVKQTAFDALTEIGIETWRQVKALG